jgi:hypothetical protein
MILSNQSSTLGEVDPAALSVRAAIRVRDSWALRTRFRQCQEVRGGGLVVPCGLNESEDRVSGWYKFLSLAASFKSDIKDRRGVQNMSRLLLRDYIPN